MKFSEEMSQAPLTEGKQPHDTPHNPSPPASFPKREDVSIDMPKFRKYLFRKP